MLTYIKCTLWPSFCKAGYKCTGILDSFYVVTLSSRRVVSFSLKTKAGILENAPADLPFTPAILKYVCWLNDSVTGYKIYLISTVIYM